MPRPKTHPNDKFSTDKFPPANFPIDKIPAHAKAKIPFLNTEPDDPGPTPVGTIDILTTETAASLGLTVLLNDGSGGFDRGQELTGSPFTHFELGDLDGDGDLDVARSFRSDDVHTVSVLLNDGTGQFSEGDSFEIDHDLNFSGLGSEFGLGDMDGDGDLDIVSLGDPNDIFLFLNDGEGDFSKGPASPTDVLDADVANGPLDFADIDGDGDLDLAIGEGTISVVYIFENDGTGALTQTDIAAVDGELLFNVILADLDNDGDADLVADGGEDAVTVTVALNDGTGDFTTLPGAIPFSTEDGVFLGMGVGDLDGDGDLDFALTESGQDEVRIFENEIVGGIPTFTAAQTIPLTDADTMHFADIDADGDLDILVSGNIAPDEGIFVLSNDGTGDFALTDFLALENPFEFLVGNLDEAVPPNSVPDPADLMIV